jgi:hypothetical protein
MYDVLHFQDYYLYKSSAKPSLVEKYADITNVRTRWCITVYSDRLYNTNVEIKIKQTIVSGLICCGYTVPLHVSIFIGHR